LVTTRLIFFCRYHPFIQHLDVLKSESAWLSFMLYIGGLTFANKQPEKYLQIPNLIAIERFAKAVLDRYHLLATDIDGALQDVGSNGDIKPLLSCYQRLMVERDLGDGDLNKSEEIHRDSIFYFLLKNPLLQRTESEYEITKVRNCGKLVINCLLLTYSFSFTYITDSVF
jgi:hypothetical protein